MLRTIAIVGTQIIRILCCIHVVSVPTWIQPQSILANAKSQRVDKQVDKLRRMQSAPGLSFN